MIDGILSIPSAAREHPMNLTRWRAARISILIRYLPAFYNEKICTCSPVLLLRESHLNGISPYYKEKFSPYILIQDFSGVSGGCE